MSSNLVITSINTIKQLFNSTSSEQISIRIWGIWNIKSESNRRKRILAGSVTSLTDKQTTRKHCASGPIYWMDRGINIHPSHAHDQPFLHFNSAWSIHLLGEWQRTRDQIDPCIAGDRKSSAVTLTVHWRASTCDPAAISLHNHPCDVLHDLAEQKHNHNFALLTSSPSQTKLLYHTPSDICT